MAWCPTGDKPLPKAMMTWLLTKIYRSWTDRQALVSNTGFGKDSRKRVRESFKCWDLVRVILETWWYFDGLLQGCGISSALAMEILKSFAKLLKLYVKHTAVLHWGIKLKTIPAPLTGFRMAISCRDVMPCFSRYSSILVSSTPSTVALRHNFWRSGNQKRMGRILSYWWLSARLW